jgi:hypothetical protein
MSNSLALSLHEKQLEIFSSPARVKVLCAGRAFGKSWTLLTTAIHFCLSYNEPINPVSPQVAAIVMPTLVHSRAIHWQPLLNLLENLSIVEQVDRSNFRIVFKGQRPDLILRGADRNGDRLRGLNLCWVGLDEYQDFTSPDIWTKVIYPALSRNRNWKALVIGTPKGRATHFHQFHLDAIANKDWAYFHYTTSDNPFISRKVLQTAAQQLPPKVFRSEMEASWEDFDGQLLPNLAEHHKVNELPKSFKSVLLGADWGEVNPYMTVIGVTHSGDYYLIDKFASDGSTPITEDEIKAQAAKFERQYNIYRCYLPDDRPASIMAFRRYGKQHNLLGMQRSIQVQRGRPGVMERALIVNSLFYQDRLFFGPNCHDMYDDFASYHRAKDRQGNLLSEPAKGQKDHSIDSVAHVIGQLEPTIAALSAA